MKLYFLREDAYYAVIKRSGLGRAISTTETQCIKSIHTTTALEKELPFSLKHSLSSSLHTHTQGYLSRSGFL